MSGRTGIHPLATIALAAALAPATAAAMTELPHRPTDPAGLERLPTLRALAEQVGWGALMETEHMKLADTAYGAPPVIAVTAAPYLPVTFFLESRRWAAQRYLGVAEADEHLAEIFVEPDEALVFDILVISEDAGLFGGATPTVRYEDATGRALPAVPLDLEVTLEPALGGALHAGRAKVLIPLPDGFAWDDVDGFTLTVEAGGVDRVLEWTFPD